jgi:hypothetical protein
MSDNRNEETETEAAAVAPAAIPADSFREVAVLLRLNTDEKNPAGRAMTARRASRSSSMRARRLRSRSCCQREQSGFGINDIVDELL